MAPICLKFEIPLDNRSWHFLRNLECTKNREWVLFFELLRGKSNSEIICIDTPISILKLSNFRTLTLPSRKSGKRFPKQLCLSNSPRYEVFRETNDGSCYTPYIHRCTKTQDAEMHIFAKNQNETILREILWAVEKSQELDFGTSWFGTIHTVLCK